MLYAARDYKQNYRYQQRIIERASECDEENGLVGFAWEEFSHGSESEAQRNEGVDVVRKGRRLTNRRCVAERGKRGNERMRRRRRELQTAGGRASSQRACYRSRGCCREGAKVRKGREEVEHPQTVSPVSEQPTARQEQVQVQVQPDKE